MNLSLRKRLTRLTLLTIGAVMLPLMLLSGLKIREEVNELSDARLAQNAKVLEALVAQFDADPGGDAAPRVVANWLRPKGADEATAWGHGYETQIGFQLWATPTRQLLTTADLANLPFDAAPVGFADAIKDRRRWRVYTKAADRGGFVRTAERYDSRREMIRGLVLQSVLPLVIGLPLLALLVGWAIRRGLAPLSGVADSLRHRPPTAMDPVDAHDAPDEVVPLVGALNGWLQRLRDVLEREREFTSNAAHELRTPLAGGLIHVENALAADADEAARTAALQDAHRALLRMSDLVNQLMTLARWDAAAAPADAGTDLAAIVTEEAARMQARAAERGARIEWRCEPAPPVAASEAASRIVVRNLVDNALRHGAAGGRVAVSVRTVGGSVELAVADDGPGIPAGQRQAMFDRFRRGADAGSGGAGLGLSIVKRVADVHGASLVLEDGEGSRGLRVRIAFPGARGGGASA